MPLVSMLNLRFFLTTGTIRGVCNFYCGFSNTFVCWLCIYIIYNYMNMNNALIINIIV